MTLLQISHSDSMLWKTMSTGVRISGQSSDGTRTESRTDDSRWAELNTKSLSMTACIHSMEDMTDSIRSDGMRSRSKTRPGSASSWLIFPPTVRWDSRVIWRSPFGILNNENELRLEYFA